MHSWLLDSSRWRRKKQPRPESNVHHHLDFLATTCWENDFCVCNSEYSSFSNEFLYVRERQKGSSHITLSDSNLIFLIHKFHHLFGPYFGTSPLLKRLNIQRRLAWSLSKNDTHNRENSELFLPFIHSLVCVALLLWVWHPFFIQDFWVPNPLWYNPK